MKRFKKLDSILEFKKPVPFLHVLRQRLGKNSVVLSGDKIHFDDAAADPSAAGEVQRNGALLKFHDGTIVKSLLGVAGTGYWKELGRTELTVVSDTVTVNPIAAKKWLMILFFRLTSGNTGQLMRFNADVGANYADRFSSNGGADIVTTSKTDLNWASGGDGDQFSTVFVRNVANKEKLVVVESVAHQMAHRPQ